MSKFVRLIAVLISIAAVVRAEPPRSKGYHLNRPNLAFTLPIKSSFRVANSKLKQHSLPSRHYGAPFGQAPPSPNYHSPSFRTPETTESIDFGLQFPATTIAPQYSEENQASVESFEADQPNAELGRLVDARQKSAKQQAEQKPQVTFQFQIPQFENGFAHALAVYNPSAQQQQAIAQNLPETEAEEPEPDQTVPQLQNPQLFAQQQLYAQYPVQAAGPLLAQYPLPAASPLVAQYPFAAAADQSPLLAQYAVQQQVFGNLLPQQILHPQVYQIQPAVQAASDKAKQIINIPEPVQQVVQGALQLAQPAIHAIVGKLPTGEPFATSSSGKLQAQPQLRQQIRKQSGRPEKLQAAPARQISQSQQAQLQQQQNAQPFAYAAIGF